MQPLCCPGSAQQSQEVRGGTEAISSLPPRREAKGRWGFSPRAGLEMWEQGSSWHPHPVLCPAANPRSRRGSALFVYTGLISFLLELRSAEEAPSQPPSNLSQSERRKHNI